MKEPMVQVTTEDFSPIVGQVEVRKVRELLRQSKSQAALELVEELCFPEIPELPKLEIEADT